MSRVGTYIICCVLALQGSFTLLAQQQQLSNITGKLSKDIELICTGSDMKFISLSLSELQGEFVFVDAPEDIDPQQLADACPVIAMSDIKIDMDIAMHDIATHFVRFKAIASQLAQGPYTAYNFRTALSRAPPSI